MTSAARQSNSASNSADRRNQYGNTNNVAGLPPHCAQPRVRTELAQMSYVPSIAYSSVLNWREQPHTIAAGIGLGSDIDAALVGVSENGIVVAFRGTLAPALSPQSLRDWWVDVAETEPKSHGAIPGKVHDGCYPAVDCVWPDLLRQLQSLHTQYSQLPLYFTGHSKGGPLATLAVARLYFDHPELPQAHTITTFASPHPGDEAFFTGLPTQTVAVTRYENYWDMVPFIPPTADAVSALSKVPIVGEVVEFANHWDYAPLGKLVYIKADRTLVHDSLGLQLTRKAEIFAQLAHGESGHKAIGAAHSHGGGIGYLSGVCADCKALSAV